MERLLIRNYKVQHPVVQLELKEFEDSIKVQKAQSWWNYCDL